MYCQSRRQAIPNQVMLLPWSTIKFSLLHSLEEICQSVRGTAIFLLGLKEVLHLLKSSKSAWCSAQRFHFSWLFNVLLKTVLHSYYESKAGCIVASLPQMNHDNTTTLLWTKQKVDYFLLWKSRWSVWPWKPPHRARFEVLNCYLLYKFTPFVWLLEISGGLHDESKHKLTKKKSKL